MTDEWYDRPLEVWRPTSASDGRGGRITTPTQVGTILAKVDQPSAVEQAAAAQSQSRHDHSVYTDGDADVRRGDELRQAGRPTMRVNHVVRPSEPIYTKALCELIQREGVA